MKYCPRCSTSKPLTEFYSDGKQGYCKECAKQYKRDTYDSRRRRLREVKLQYSLTADEYETLEAAGCGICGSHDNLVVDHNHQCCPERKKSCGKCVRAMLCSNHNILLGMASDDVDILRKAIEYLERY